MIKTGRGLQEGIPAGDWLFFFALKRKYPLLGVAVEAVCSEHQWRNWRAEVKSKRVSFSLSHFVHRSLSDSSDVLTFCLSTDPNVKDKS